MTNFFEEFENQNSYSDTELFTKIWSSPREIFRFIHEKSYDKYLTILLILSGISSAFDRAYLKDMGDHLSLWAILTVCIIFGGLFGWISYYIYAALISWTGKWLNGECGTKAILRILSFAMIPSIISIIFILPQIIIYENEIFKSDGDISSAGLVLNILVYGSIFLEFVFSICSIVFCVIGISEVQKFSIGKALLNLLLPLLLFLVPILLFLNVMATSY